MKPRVYVETSVVSYLTAQPSRDIVIAGRQQVTREWWAMAAARFELVIAGFRHLANAVVRPRIDAACRDAGFEPPVICTPEELMEVPDDGRRSDRG